MINRTSLKVFENIIYDAEEVSIRTTGRDYDFIATVENKTDESIVIAFENEYEHIEPITIYPYDWIGVLADEEGNLILQAFKEHKFCTMYEDTYKEEFI